MLAYIAAALLILIAALHSVLGEQALLRPLFATTWHLDIPRDAAERIFRFAWHLTSLAWLGLAATLLGLESVHAMGFVCAASGAFIFVSLRGHLAWPLFFAAGAAAWLSVDAIPEVALLGASLLGAALAVGLAGVHVYWAVGGRRGRAAALPQDERGKPLFAPGPVACAAVAAACATLAALLASPALGAPPTFVRIGLWLALGAFVARAVGDGRQVGFSKSNRDTAFAKADDALYSPLVVALAFACAAALQMG